MVIIDGKETAMEIKQEIAKEVKRMMAAGEKQPHLAAILVGHDGGSETYVANNVDLNPHSFVLKTTLQKTNCSKPSTSLTTTMMWTASSCNSLCHATSTSKK